MSDRAEELANQHWEGYVGGLVAVHLTKDTYTKEEVLAMCRYHYVSSHIHGAKHEAEARQEISGKAMDVDMTSILRYPPAHPYKHKDEVEVCATCQSWGRGCQGREDLTACDKYISPSPPADQWAERDLCRRCGRESCASAGKTRLVPTCERYEPKVEK